MVYQPLDSMLGNINEQQQQQHRRQQQDEEDTRNKRTHEEELFLAKLSKRVNKHPSEEPEMNPQEKSDNLNRLSGFGLGVGSLYAEESLGYPFLVLRRQCQLNHTALRHHIMPISLFRVIGRIHHRQGKGTSQDVDDKNQGINVFWKGWGSNCVVKGLNLVTEIALFELLHVPRDTVDQDDVEKKEKSSKKRILKEILKGASLLIMLPFYSASLIDTVQSATIDDTRSIFTFTKDAVNRIFGWYTAQGHGRLLPFHALILPTMLHGILRYTLQSMITYAIVRFHKRKLELESPNKNNMNQIYYTELIAALTSSMLTEVLLYPLETCLMRLHLQGTRTIIDDTDKGIGVLPLCTNYTGLSDCAKTIKREEGVSGFYKGFAALILQYSVQFCVVRISKIFYFNN